MGVRFPSAASNTLLAANVPINGHVIVCTTPPINLPIDAAMVLLFWYIVHTVGATAATTQYLLRRGATVASPAVNVQQPITAVAGNIVEASGWYFDSPGMIAEQQYSLDCIDVGSTGLGAIQDACIIAFVL